MVYEESQTWQGGRLKGLKKSLKSLGKGLKTAPPLLQLIGKPGSGCRRLAFDFLTGGSRVAWISLKWNLHAPLLWKIAADHNIRLLGVECSQRKRLRTLWKELYESQAFDGWILDGLQLKAGEGAFLQKLIASNKSLKIIVIDSFPHSFCAKRAHIDPSHLSYRVTWSKGGSPTPKFYPSPFLHRLWR